MQINRNFFSFLLLSALLITGCGVKAEIDISDTLTKVEKHFESMGDVSSVASAFNGDTDEVKFRLMLEEQQTKAEASQWFEGMLTAFTDYADDPEMWEDYHAAFDLKTYNDGVIYRAVKRAGEELTIEAVNE